MNSTVLLDASIVLAAGVMQGLFAVPMKYAKRWQYENIWLVFAFSGLVVFPWFLTLATIPQIGHIYAATPSQTLAAVIGFGVCWGTGATMTGLALNMLGIGLAMAIVLGLSASVGSLIPQAKRKAGLSADSSLVRSSSLFPGERAMGATM